MTGCVYGLWLGGGITFDALEIVEATLRQRAENEKEGPVKTELMNLANAAHADLTKRPGAPQTAGEAWRAAHECDLI